MMKLIDKYQLFLGGGGVCLENVRLSLNCGFICPGIP
jgi:hypothetical protein